MSRKIKDYLVIGLKGMAMGAADVVPGVSGGTIAFISGIYEELLGSISNVNLGLFKTLKKEGFKAAWKQLNGNFLLALFIGIFIISNFLIGILGFFGVGEYYLYRKANYKMEFYIHNHIGFRRIFSLLHHYFKSVSF